MGAQPNQLTPRLPTWSNDYYHSQTSPNSWKQYTTNIGKNWQSSGPAQSQYNSQQSYQNVFNNAYSGAEMSAVQALKNMLQGGGISPEQKKTMYEGVMTPVREEAKRQEQNVINNAYARGLGQSTVLNKMVEPIEQGVQQVAAQTAGQIENTALQNKMDAIRAIQSGAIDTAQIRAGLEQLNAQKEALNAQLRQEENALREKYGEHMDTMLAQLADLQQRQYATEQQKELAEEQFRNNWNLSVADLQRLYDFENASIQQQNYENTASFWANILGTVIGGGANVLGTTIPV